MTRSITKWLFASLFALSLGLGAHATIEFNYFYHGNGLQNDYKQYGPEDEIIQVLGYWGPATNLSYIHGPPYRLEITVDTDVTPDYYYVGDILYGSSYESVYATIH